MIDTEECFEKKLLKKDNADIGLAKKSIKQAEFFLGEASDLINLEKKEISVMSLYNAYFHTSRALLFKDGIKERSHYCLARYIESEYVKKKRLSEKFLNTFENLMNLRKNIQYSTEKAMIDEDLDESCNICEEFISIVREIIE